MTLERKTPMKPGKPLERRTRIKARANLQATKAPERRTRIAPESKKRKAERPTRAKVRATVLARDRGCRALGLLPGRCRSPYEDRPELEVHEVIPRSLWRAGYLVVANCVALCQAHHDLVTENDTLARSVGLSAPYPTGVDKLPRDPVERGHDLDRPPHLHEDPGDPLDLNGPLPGLPRRSVGRHRGAVPGLLEDGGPLDRRSGRPHDLLGPRHSGRRHRGPGSQGLVVDDVDPADLCQLCVFPAVQTARMRDDWRDLEAGDVVQTCACCGDWLIGHGLAGNIAAMPRKALR